MSRRSCNPCRGLSCCKKWQNKACRGGCGTGSAVASLAEPSRKAKMPLQALQSGVAQRKVPLQALQWRFAERKVPRKRCNGVLRRAKCLCNRCKGGVRSAPGSCVPFDHFQRPLKAPQGRHSPVMGEAHGDRQRVDPVGSTAMLSHELQSAIAQGSHPGLARAAPAGLTRELHRRDRCHGPNSDTLPSNAAPEFRTPSPRGKCGERVGVRVHVPDPAGTPHPSPLPAENAGRGEPEDARRPTRVQHADFWVRDRSAAGRRESEDSSNAKASRQRTAGKLCRQGISLPAQPSR